MKMTSSTEPPGRNEGLSDWVWLCLAVALLLVYGWFCALLGAYVPWLPFFPLGM